MTSPAASDSSCCPEYAAVSRRGLLGGALALAGATSSIGSAVLTASPASAASARAVLVVLSLRGAADGMSLVVPHGDPVYYQARPRLAVPRAQLLAADSFFGLHPRLSALLPHWSAGRVAAVHAAGLPVANRSHFAAMEEVEDANPGSTARQGWLNRLVGLDASASSLQGFSVGAGVVPGSLAGPQPVMAARSVESVGIPGDDRYDERRGRLRSLHTLWDGDRSPLGRGMASTFAAVRDFAPARTTTDRTSAYPDSDLGRALAAAARIIRGDVGVTALTVDQGDWDMHSDLGTLQWGRMLRNAEDLGRSLAAFLGDLGTQAGKVTLVAISEFGRRVAENDSLGLDHGHGNVVLLAGAGVRGGYHGRWPGLAATLDADLPVTTDYRDVLADVVAARFGATAAARVFPGLVRRPTGAMLGA